MRVIGYRECLVCQAIDINPTFGPADQRRGSCWRGTPSRVSNRIAYSRTSWLNFLWESAHSPFHKLSPDMPNYPLFYVLYSESHPRPSSLMHELNKRLAIYIKDLQNHIYISFSHFLHIIYEGPAFLHKFSSSINFKTNFRLNSMCGNSTTLMQLYYHKRIINNNSFIYLKVLFSIMKIVKSWLPRFYSF